MGGELGVAKIRDFPGGIADKQSKKAVLAISGLFFLSADPQQPVIWYSENTKF